MTTNNAPQAPMTTDFSMHRHYIATPRLHESSLTLTREDARHLQTVLRLRVNDEVELFDGCGTTVRARVASAERHSMTLTPLATPIKHPPPACRLTLFACISKGKRMDWTIEKGVELGVSRIVPVISDRTIVRLDEEDADGKTGRWLRVAIEAARQSGTAWLPTIDAPLPLAEAGPLVRACAPVFVAALVPEAQPMRQALEEFRARSNISTYGGSGGPALPCPRDGTRGPPELCASAPLREKAPAGLHARNAPPATAGWFVGPEGDFTPEELQLLVAHGAIPVSLGKQVLRAETAAIWGLCVLGAEWL
jgi:16S rRNA (uracil1498-N3)-methyltransferase